MRFSFDEATETIFYDYMSECKIYHENILPLIIM